MLIISNASLWHYGALGVPSVPHSWTLSSGCTSAPGERSSQPWGKHRNTCAFKEQALGCCSRTSAPCVTPSEHPAHTITLQEPPSWEDKLWNTLLKNNTTKPKLHLKMLFGGQTVVQMLTGSIPHPAATIHSSQTAMPLALGQLYSASWWGQRSTK